MNQLTLEILEQTLKDWSLPYVSEYSLDGNNHTTRGFCRYFNQKFDIDFYHLLNINEAPWAKYVTSTNGDFHFHGSGKTFLGRAERVTAIKGMINDLKNQ